MKRGYGIGVLAVAITFAVTCSLKQEPPLRLGLLEWPPFELAYLARHLGHLDDRIEIVDYRSPAEALRAYRHGVIDVLAATTEYVLHVADTDADQRIVLVIDISAGGDALLARPHVTSLADLRGRRVGAEASALGAHLLSRALESALLDQRDIDFVPIDVGEQAQAFRDGRVDAVLTYEPARSQLLAEGAVQLFSSADIPGEIVDVLFTRRQVVERRRSDVAAIVNGWLAAQAHLAAEPDAAIALMASRTGVSQDVFRTTLDGIELPDLESVRGMMSGDEPALLEVLARQAGIMRSLGLLREDHRDLRKLLDDSFLPPP